MNRLTIRQDAYQLSKNVADTDGDIDVVLKANIDGATADATAKVIDTTLEEGASI